MKRINADCNFILQTKEAERRMYNAMIDIQRWFEDHPKSSFNICCNNIVSKIHPDDVEDFKKNFG